MDDGCAEKGQAISDAWNYFLIYGNVALFGINTLALIGLILSKYLTKSIKPTLIDLIIVLSFAVGTGGFGLSWIAAFAKGEVETAWASQFPAFIFLAHGLFSLSYWATGVLSQLTMSDIIIVNTQLKLPK